MATEYPALRLLTDQPRWVSRLNIDGVEIQAEVTGIRNFTLNNELGEADTAQPFQPFGIQGQRGASFLFGSTETGLKPLLEVRLRGTWKNLPGTEAEFNSLYKEYDTHADLFTVSVEYRQGGRWKRCGEGQRLFRPLWQRRSFPCHLGISNHRFWRGSLPQALHGSDDAQQPLQEERTHGNPTGAFRTVAC